MVETRIIVPRATRSPSVLYDIPDITIAVGETHDMSQYINDQPGYEITDSQVLNLNTNIATYDHATKLLTGVAGGTMTGLQYEVTLTEIATGGNAWSYPGIPYPTETNAALEALGYTAWPYDPCTLDHAALPDPWTSEVAGFYYVDNEIGTNTGRTYGTPSAPRSTIPSLSAGDVVVMNGDYSVDINGTNFVGTSANPIFIVNASGGDARWRGRFQIGSSSAYLVVDGVDGWWPGSGGTGKMSLAGSYCCYRNATLASDESTVGYGGTSVSGNHHVIYNCTISGAGWLATPVDADTHGTKVSPGTTDVWIIDSTYSRNSGDGIQVGDNVGTSRCERVFVAGCTASENRQAGFWSKTSQDVIWSNNVSHTHAGGVGGAGTGIGGQYDSDQIWVIFNTCYTNTSNIGFEGRSAVTVPDRYAAIGNLCYDNTGSVPNTDDPNSAAGIKNRGMLSPAIVDNTVVDTNNGYGSAVATDETIHGNVFGDPQETNGRSLYCPNEDGTGSSNYNVFEQTEEIGWQDNSRDTLSQHQTDTGEDANSTSSANLLFVNAAGGNYRPDTGSPLLNASIEHGIYAEFETRYGLSIKVDRDGNARPTSGSWDAGCYQVS